MFSDDRPLSKKLYIIGVVVIFIAVYSQYFIKYGTVIGFLVVYGIPIAVTSAIFGRTLIKRIAKNNKTATKYGLGLFGAMTLLGLFLAAAALTIIESFEPTAIDLLQRPNPVLEVPQNVAWIMVAVSILVVGPAEEYLFRGFMYGGLLNLTKGRLWLPLAVFSSLLFAAVHGYYAVTYGVTSIIFFIVLSTFGFAMCVTYYWSGGNILVPALIHGIWDAIGFLGVAESRDFGLTLQWIFIAIALIFAAIYLPRKIRMPTTPPQGPAETQLSSSLPQAPPDQRIARCSNCGTINSADASFCTKCGAHLQQKASNLG